MGWVVFSCIDANDCTAGFADFLDVVEICCHSKFKQKITYLEAGLSNPPKKSSARDMNNTIHENDTSTDIPFGRDDCSMLAECDRPGASLDGAVLLEIQ